MEINLTDVPYLAKLIALCDLVRDEISEERGDSERSKSDAYQAIEEGFFELGFGL